MSRTVVAAYPSWAKRRRAASSSCPRVFAASRCLPVVGLSSTVGLLSALFGIGAGLGIVLAGPIVDHLSWQWLFWLPLVLIAAALLVAFGVPESPVRTPGRLDVLGAGILSA